MTMKKKRILIPVFAEVPNYINALQQLGCEVFVTDEIIDISSFDRLLLPGGEDIDPHRYGEEINGSERMTPALDELQFSTLDQFVRCNKPVFGICRGHQLINVYFGGSLYQDHPLAYRHRYDRVKQADRVHMNTAEEGSFIYELYGNSFSTNSAHHQAVKQLGKGLHICRYSDDGIPEAMYHTTLPVYSVQWHPERMCFEKRRDDTVDGSLMLKWFVDNIPSGEKA
ncbi:MAG: gamma-glutamyl-gamma-aminobutyrate hydrolase family protein [Erysipelotrichaceae bacterium]|nr:gamma-glutamyl-gamma-aminobutyrate hydrolase family protein [Erysipelotrichaceae bacterium]